MGFSQNAKRQIILNIFIWATPLLHIIILTKISPYTTINEANQTALIQFLLANTFLIALSCLIVGTFFSSNSAGRTHAHQIYSSDDEYLIRCFIIISLVACMFHVYAKLQNPNLELDQIKGFRVAWLNGYNEQESVWLKSASFIGIFVGSLIMMLNAFAAFKAMSQNITKLIIYHFIVFVIGLTFAAVIGSRFLLVTFIIMNISGVLFNLITEHHDKYFVKMRRAILIIFISTVLNFSTIFVYSILISQAESRSREDVEDSSEIYVGDYLLTEYNLIPKICLPNAWLCNSKMNEDFKNTIGILSIYASHGIYNGTSSIANDNPRNEFFNALNFYFSKFNLSQPFTATEKNYGRGTIPFLFAVKQDFGSPYAYLLSSIFGVFLGFLSTRAYLVSKYRNILLFIFSATYYVYAISWLAYAPITLPFIIIALGIIIASAIDLLIRNNTQKDNGRFSN